MSCGVGDKCGSDPVLLWLWCLPVAVIPFQPLSWEFSYAMGGPKLEEKKKKALSGFLYQFSLPISFFSYCLFKQTKKKWLYSQHMEVPRQGLNLDPLTHCSRAGLQ